MSERTTYVYCVVDRSGPLSMRGVPAGVPGGSTPALLPLTRRLSIVASAVPRDAYAPEIVDARLRDLDWVSGIALAHEAVVERMTRVRGATVIPMKLFTMFSEPDRAVSELRKRQRQLERIVQRIHGCEEWGVRVTRGARPSDRRVRAAAPATGTAYLSARKQARDDLREQSAKRRTAAADTLAALGRLAKGAKPRPAPESAASPPLLDAAFLVPRTRSAGFHAGVKRAAARCREAGAELTVSGPWPAYNFIDGGEGL